MVNEENHMQNDIKIDRNIPIPLLRLKAKYPWKQLEVGDSFEVKEDARRVCAAASGAGARLQKKFKVRSTGEGTCRVWRIE